MTQAQHTPGPWVASPNIGYWMVGAPVSEELPAHADRHIGNIYSEDNARLIAAAPDLLAALDQVDAYLSPFDGEEDAYAEIRSVIQQAIAKAKGK